ncbi:MAG: branched-chain amino acid ABC transporter ATP-binding protein/permease, partial [Acidimicrobiia bacterium]
IGLESIALTFLVVQAFGAAAHGIFTSIPLTYLGGIVIGVISDVSKKYTIDVSWLNGFPASAPFLVLFVVLLVSPKHKLVPPSGVENRPMLQWHGPRNLRIGVGVVVFALLALVPQVVGIKLSYWTVGLTQVILVLALGLLVRTAGLVSLCTSAFAAIGAVAFSQFAVDHGMPWLVALLLAGLVAVPVGAIVAIPSIRLSGMFLALATLGFGIMIEKMFYGRNIMFTLFTEGRKMPRPDGFTSDESYYYVVLAFVMLTVAAMGLVHRGRLGRILKGLGDSPTAVNTLGLSTNVTRVLVFCISAFFAAISGVLYGGQVVYATAADRYYTSFWSIALLAVLALAPFRDPWFAVFAGVSSVIPGYIDSKHTADVMNVIFGFFAVLVALEGGPAPMPRKLQLFFERVGGADKDKARAEARSAKQATMASGATDSARPTNTVGLAVENLSVRFGGLVAVDGVSFEAPLGRITGLIGPNGAGKTTTFNSCSGLNKPSSGRVTLHGRDISSLSPAARAREGLGRTFQIMQLCESLTVADNVALGRESSQAGAKVLSQIAASPADNHVRAASTAEALELCGISSLAHLQAGSLSTGQRRLVELARCLAGPFDLLLLDEPSSGLDREETERFGQVLANVVRERGCGILLVEHDMSLVMKVCSYIYVLDFGRQIFEGTAAEVAASPAVQAAYLGSEAADLQASTNG